VASSEQTNKQTARARVRVRPSRGVAELVIADRHGKEVSDVIRWLDLGSWGCGKARHRHELNSKQASKAIPNHRHFQPS